LSDVNPDFHTFSVLDLNISYPYRPAKLNQPLFILFSIVIPILTVILICSVTSFPPRHSRQHNVSPTQARISKLRCLNAALLGLGVSLATSTVIVTGVKNLTGKPRPNFLSICNPNLENIEKFTVGGFGAEFNRLWVMVNVEICRQTDKGTLRDGFRSFPSGFATSEFRSSRLKDQRLRLLNMVTVAFAGLWYLSLFLCYTFGVVFPPLAAPLASSGSQSNGNSPQAQSDESHQPLQLSVSEPRFVPAFQQGEHRVAVPAHLLLLPYIPLGLAIFIAGTRYFDFRNHGFDVLAGAAVGSVTAWIGFRIFQSSLGSPRVVCLTSA
jgi:membrane-associated phospholipid phosphatase